MESLASVLFAARCRLCDDLLTSASPIPVCPSCLGRVRPLEPLASCYRCQVPLSAAVVAPGELALCGACREEKTVVDRLRAFGTYEGELRALIVLLKYHRVRPLARPLAGWLAALLHQEPKMGEADAIVPVPLYPARKRVRGYNQSELLARELARWTGLPVWPGWLQRTKDTPSQTGLTPLQREANVRGAFTCGDKRAETRILLVDDVCTTGATLNACARSLKRAGAARVNAVAVARVVQEI